MAGISCGLIQDDDGSFTTFIDIQGVEDFHGEMDFKYGWDDLDIQGIIAKLFKSQKIKLECSGENITIDNRDVVNYITKRDYVEKTKVKVRKGVPNK